MALAGLSMESTMLENRSIRIQQYCCARGIIKIDCTLILGITGEETRQITMVCEIYINDDDLSRKKSGLRPSGSAL